MNKTMGGSYHNLVALADAKYSDARQVSATAARSPLSLATHSSSALSLDSQGGRSRLIIVSNVLPVHQRRVGVGWEFEGNEDALIAQAMDGIPEEYDVIFVGCTPSDVDIMEQEEVTQQLKAFGCAPVFLPPDVRERYYKGFCKQQLWPLFHYVLPMSPSSAGRYCAELWQAYVKANKAFTERVVEECATDADTVWIHDYHLLAMPSLLRKRFNKIRCGLFLHSPFPSSEMFRAFPKRDELLRSMLNADLIGFHTFDYARHFLSCCSRMLGLEHQTTRGSISVEYYGRNVGVKIMPTGVNPARLLSGFDWPEFRWRRGELRSQFEGRKLLLGLDDMDVFKGIELKLQAFERVLEDHPEFVGQVVLAQITDAPRSSGKELSDLNEYVDALVERINARFGRPGYQPVFYLRRPMPLHERIAFLSLADAAVVTATRDGMNLVPYEYVVCRQGPGGKGLEEPEAPRESMLVVSEFVGCSPSLSGAIRVNPWSIEGVADGMYAALRASKQERALRHDKHWRYVSQHTVAYWAQSFVTDL
ncbi:trehalose-6-phosphate synthase phosphatase, partial [Raphidocelis subcapitata]